MRPVLVVCVREIDACLLESQIKGGTNSGCPFYRGFDLLRESRLTYRVQAVASVGKMSLQINSELLRTVKKDTDRGGNYHTSNSGV